MKFYKYFYYAIFILSLSACEPSNNEYFGEPVSRDSFRPTRQISYNSLLNLADTLFFTYQQPNDFYPVEILCKNSFDSVVWIKKYELDSWRLPNKEQLYVNDSLLQTTLLKYSPKNYYLLEKSIYNGIDVSSNLLSKQVFNYDEEDFLISIVTEKYSLDSNYINVDSNKITEHTETRVLPNTLNRFKGNSVPLEFTEKYVKYWTLEEQNQIPKKKRSHKKKAQSETNLAVGAVQKSINTDFDSDGFPAYTVETLSDSMIKEIWYKTEKDGLGQVIRLTGYNDFECTQIADDCLSYKFFYDNEGFIFQYDRRLFNRANSKFDRVESSTLLDWLSHKVNNPQNFILMKLGRRTKYFNYEKGAYYVYEHLITKFEVDEISEEFYAYPFNISAKERKKLRANMKITTLLEMIKIRTFRGL